MRFYLKKRGRKVSALYFFALMIQESRLLQGSDGKLQGYDTFGNEMGSFIYRSIQSVRQPVHSAVDALNT